MSHSEQISEADIHYRSAMAIAKAVCDKEHPIFKLTGTNAGDKVWGSRWFTDAIHR